MKSILIADDHAVVRKGLMRILSEGSQRTAVDEAGTAGEALEMAAAKHYDAVILDISLPDRNGLEVLKEIRERRPGLPVLILSVHPEEQYAVRALRGGAMAYLTKDGAPEELLKALAAVLQGRRYIGASLAEKLADTLAAGAPRPPHESFSEREFEVFDRLARGRSVAQIAAELFLSPKTVSTYRRRILDKMGMSTTAEIIRYAAKTGLVD